MAKVRLADIAERVGTSVSSVSVVLRGSRGSVRVSPGLRARIEDAARELGYVMPGSLEKPAIALVLGERSSSCNINDQLFWGLTESDQRSGLAVPAVRLSDEELRSARLPGTLRAWSVQAVIMSYATGDLGPDGLGIGGLPAIWLNRKLPENTTGLPGAPPFHCTTLLPGR
ncbi:MAG: LacI family DNA-binding transcriptional regulator [Planctomycetota bacterium]